MKAPLVRLAVFLLFTAWIQAESVKDREGAVRKDREAMENDKRWIYNDYPRGLLEARRSGKPLLVVLRCVPCLACAGIDASVLTEPSLSPLLDQFVCVRVINANALDLSLFQVDYDLSFSSVLFNGDGTIYGRYGSWVHQKNAQDKTTSGFREALRAALALHAGYPGNRSSLAGKQGVPTPYRTTLDIPGLNGKYALQLDWNGKVVPSCVHCHQIGDAIRSSFHDRKAPIPDEWVYPWPAPETLGIMLAPEFTARIDSVAPGSIAGVAGLRAGDDLVSIQGQPLISAADVSWILHRTGSSGTLSALVKRNGELRPLQIGLPEGWRRDTDIARRGGTWQLRGFASGGLWLEDLDDAARKARGLGTNQMALLIKHAGEYGIHAAAKKAGFRKDDVLTEVDGDRSRRTESQVLGTLLKHHGAGDLIHAKVLRDSSTIELVWPMQ